MMSGTVTEPPRIAKQQNDRNKVATSIIDFEKAKNDAISQRQFALNSGIPRSTLQGWLERRECIAS